MAGPVLLLCSLVWAMHDQRSSLILLFAHCIILLFSDRHDCTTCPRHAYILQPYFVRVRAFCCFSTRLLPHSSQWSARTRCQEASIYLLSGRRRKVNPVRNLHLTEGGSSEILFLQTRSAISCRSYRAEPRDFSGRGG